MNLSGTWSGTYSFGPEDGRAPVTFELRLQQGWLGRIVGTVTDGPGGMPERGDIRGRTWSRTIRFVKWMPVARVASGGASVPLAEAVAAKGWGNPLDTAHPPIVYKGRLAEDGQSASGTWHIRSSVFALAGGSVAGIRVPALAGSWTAERVLA